MIKLVSGVGINDADYVVNPKIGNKRVMCPFYMTWFSMIGRCYNSNIHKRQPTYIGCSVDPRWHSFMSFKSWMIEQDWVGKHLDKDLLISGNKVYGPDTCVFVSQRVNNFTIGKVGVSKLKGISFNKSKGKYEAWCSDTTSKGYLGTFISAEDARIAYCARKLELAKEIISEQTDLRITEAITKWCKRELI